MLRRILKKRDFFFQNMALLAGKGAEIVAEVRAMLADLPHVKEHVGRIQHLEDEADTITHETISRLHKTFITPIDRNEINQIFKRLDDIVDFVEAAAQRMLAYDLHSTRPDLEQLLEVLERQITLLQQVIARLDDLRQPEPIRALLIEVHTLENRADNVLRDSMQALFRDETDTKTLLKWKEILENIEDATDRCEDVADLFENILLEYA